MLTPYLVKMLVRVIKERGSKNGNGENLVCCGTSFRARSRGTEAVDTGDAISVPVGEATLGRVFNVLGEAIDLAGPVAADVPRSPILVLVTVFLTEA